MNPNVPEKSLGDKLFHQEVNSIVDSIISKTDISISSISITVSTYLDMIAHIAITESSVNYTVINDEERDRENSNYYYSKQNNSLVWVATVKIQL